MSGGAQGVAYFSNPEKTYNGDPMGVPADHPSTGVDGPADAVGTLNNRRGDRRQFPPELGFTNTESGPDAFPVLAVGEWRSQHGDGDAAQALERRHHRDGIGLAGLMPST